MRVPTYFSALPPLSGRSRAVAVHPEINPWSQSMVSLGVPAPNFVGLWLQLNQPPPRPPPADLTSKERWAAQV